MAALFPTSTFLHLGGDELPKTSWAGNASVAAWMKSRGLDTDSAMCAPAGQPTTNASRCDAASDAAASGPRLDLLLLRLRPALHRRRSYFVNRVKRGPRLTAANKSLVVHRLVLNAPP